MSPQSIRREERLQMRNSGLKSSGTATLSWSGYADDLILFLCSKTDLQTATAILDRIFARYGLSVNENKTETMVLNNLEPEYPRTIVSLRSTPLNNDATFKYLGALIQHNQPNTSVTTEYNWQYPNLQSYPILLFL